MGIFLFFRTLSLPGDHELLGDVNNLYCTSYFELFFKRHSKNVLLIAQESNLAPCSGSYPHQPLHWSPTSPSLHDDVAIVGCRSLLLPLMSYYSSTQMLLQTRFVSTAKHLIHKRCYIPPIKINKNKKVKIPHLGQCNVI